ncbi:ImmA/IrrE family metallo-endopeptidase [Nocardia crassostreae]|uniref:ImmA/IrrE family metallo-endopeptidase n=1 Tax=Nocardia crassostreae TaxID=53428 RepID=UPI000831143F|nr:ImmA/IrrE family metallo-endopeptidase [Nocardia crassostreae]
MPRRKASKRYDARTHAAKLDLTIGVLPFEARIVIWEPRRRAVMIAADLTAVDRREGLAHAIAHAQLEHSEVVRRTRMGRESRLAAELRVYEVACRNLIPVDALREALARYTRVEDAADLLQVNPDTVRHRLRTLSRAERRALPADMVDRLDWSDAGDYPLPISCVWTDAQPVPVHRKLSDALRTTITEVVAYR